MSAKRPSGVLAGILKLLSASDSDEHVVIPAVVARALAQHILELEALADALDFREGEPTIRWTDEDGRTVPPPCDQTRIEIGTWWTSHRACVLDEGHREGHKFKTVKREW